MSRLIRVYIDESGQPSQSKASSRHFVMGAVLVRDERLSEALEWLVAAKASCNRRPEHELHWNKVRKPGQRLRIAEMLGEQPWGRFIAVVACKDHLEPADHLNDDGAYMYTLRYLLERVSWFVRQYGDESHVTIAHKVRFKKEKLLEYTDRLRSAPGCQIDFRYLDPGMAVFDQPRRCEMLQVADSMTSAVAAGFEVNDKGELHPEYVQAFHGRMYRGFDGKRALTSYGLKMHPWRDATKAAYPWVAAL